MSRSNVIFLTIVTVIALVAAAAVSFCTMA